MLSAMMWTSLNSGRPGVACGHACRANLRVMQPKQTRVQGDHKAMQHNNNCRRVTFERSCIHYPLSTRLFSLEIEYQRTGKGEQDGPLPNGHHHLVAVKSGIKKWRRNRWPLLHRWQAIVPARIPLLIVAVPTQPAQWLELNDFAKHNTQHPDVHPCMLFEAACPPDCSCTVPGPSSCTV